MVFGMVVEFESAQEARIEKIAGYGSVDQLIVRMTMFAEKTRGTEEFGCHRQRHDPEKKIEKEAVEEIAVPEKEDERPQNEALDNQQIAEFF